MKRFAAPIALVFLTGCVHRLSSTMNAWVGKDEAALVSSWGAPDLTAPLSDGSRVLTWVNTWRDAASEKMECRRSFTVSPAGKVLKWSANGCPVIYRS